MIDLSTVEYNPFYGWYDTQIVLDGKKLVLNISGQSGEARPALEQRVGAVLAWLSDNLAVMRAYCADQLYQTYLDGWVNDAHPVVSREMFMAALQLGAVRFHPDHSLTLTFLDGGVFWGHWVMVGLAPDYTPTQAYLEG
jgi:hypothetical protein